MENKFRASDATLKELVNARREEVIQLQKAEAKQLADLEARGQEQLKNLKGKLPKELLATLDSFDKDHYAAAELVKTENENLEKKLILADGPVENRISLFPDEISGQLLAAGAIGTIAPYYGTLHGSNGTIYWQGYNPGNINLSDSASGAGSGLAGTGAASFTMYMDWWFTYRPTENRNYSHRVSVPFHGFYILKADDGFFTSKEAKSRIDLTTVGYQYNYKAPSSTNVFAMGNQNINVNDRFDGWRTMYYSSLFGADRAYIRVTAKFYVYARGGGSNAQLNFSAGAANYVGVPLIYVD